MKATPAIRIGIDAGGTFTDFIVAPPAGAIESFKLRSNPADPASVILAGISQALDGAAATQAAEIVHGSTVATNALLERKGARTAFVTTAGFEDLLHIARQNRAELYNLTPLPRAPLIEPRRCYGVKERTHFDGAIARAPDPDAIAQLAARLAKAGIESVAICFLHSYANTANERATARLLRRALPYVSVSHEVSPEFREYERASTTAINAYVGPLMKSYLGRLERRARRPISILQSNGGRISIAEAGRHAVRTVLSGPAGGVAGAWVMARRAGFTRILGFDMGGTSTDVSLCDGEPGITMESAIDGFPIRVPMLDIHTVGAGGGSIARTDEGGLLRVGPESAGADPGPACYGSGEAATVTDAHVVLGRIAPAQFLAGAMTIFPERSAHAVDAIAAQLGLTRTAAAAGIVRVANANMERAIRAVSLERGYDPRDFTLVAFGGGGGLHACELAAELGIRTVLVPRFAEGLSALGMLLADAIRDYSASALGTANPEPLFRRLEARARREAPVSVVTRTADLRYRGQSYELNVPWRSRQGAETAFHQEHQRVYSYATPEREVELVAVRVRSRIAAPEPKFAPLRAPDRASAAESRRVFSGGRWRKSAVRQRAEVTRRHALAGPALVLDYGATTLVPTGWYARTDSSGNLLITRRAGH